MTISNLVKGRSTLDQLDIFMRADILLPCGRYFGGILTPSVVESLTPIKKGR